MNNINNLNNNMKNMNNNMNMNNNNFININNNMNINNNNYINNFYYKGDNYKLANLKNIKYKTIQKQAIFV